MSEVLKRNQEGILFALYEAIRILKLECLNPMEICEFVLPHARVFSLEPWESTVEVLEELVSKNYAEHCQPRTPILGYNGYKVTSKGSEYAEGLQKGNVKRG